MNNNIDTIYLNGTNIAPSSNSSDQIVFNHDLTIVGLDGSYVGYENWSAYPNNLKYNYIPFLSNSNLNIVFENVTFQYLADNILIKVAGNGNYVFKNCVFTNINATGSHQAVVWLNSGSALLDNCSFIECNTSYGAVSNYNENSVNLVHMTVKDSTFNYNWASVEPGCINNCGQLVVLNSTFYYNNSTWWAGAIHTHIGANTTIRNSRFIDNYAGWNGGALYTYSTLSVYDSTFIGNNCTTNSGGGAIGVLAYWGQEPPVVIFDNCSFVNNTNNEHSTGNGGVISMSGGELTMTNNYFENNAAVRGKAIYAVSLSNGVLVNNTFVNHTNATLGINTIIFKADSYMIENNSYVNSLIELDTYELSADFSFSTVTTCHLKIVGLGYGDLIKSSNYAVHNGDEVFTISGVDYNELTSTIDFTINTSSGSHAVNVTSNILNRTSNTIQVPIPAIYVSTTGKDTNDGLTISTPVKTIGQAVTLSKNNNIPTIAVASGIYPISSRISITKDVHFIGDGNVIFNANSFSGTQEFYASAQTTCTFENINLVNSGKTIFQGTLNNIKLEFINCTVKDNSLTSGYLIRTQSLLIVDSVFENNARSVYFTKGDVINSTFIDNTGADGVLYLRGSGNTFNIINSSFINNGGTNGVIYAYQFKNINVDGCLFVNNTATSGSAIYIYSRSSSCSIVVEDCVFLNNYVSSSIVRSGTHTGTIVTANNNWWGNTADNYNANLTSVSSGVTVSSWLFMNLSADSNPVIVGDRKNVDITFNNLYTPEAIIHDINNNLPKLDLDVSCVNGAAESTVTLINDVSNVDYVATNEGDGVLTVSYEGISQNITLNNLGYNFTVDVCDIKLGDDEIINVTLPSDATGTVSIKVGNYETNASLVNGAISFVISGLEGGQYDVLLTYDGNYRGFDYTTLFNVDSTEITLRYASKLIFGSDITLNVFVVDDATGTVEVSVNGVSNNYTLSYGGVNVLLNNLTNTSRNIITVYYYGDENYAPGCIDTYLMFNDGNYQWAMEGHDTKNTGKSYYVGTDVADDLWSIQFNDTIVDSIIDEEGSIYIATLSSIYKYDSTGVFMWKFGLVGDANFSGLAISRDVIIAPRAGDTIYFINKDNGVQYSFANIWQGSSLFEPVVDDEGNIYISGEYQNVSNDASKNYYILTVIPYDMWVNGGDPTVVNLGLHNLTSAPTIIEKNKTVCIGSTDGLLIVNITNKSYINISYLGGVVCRPVVADDGTIYYLTNNQLIKTSVNGNIAFNNSVVGYNLALSDNQIIIAGTDCLYYFNLTNGNKIEKFLSCNSSSKILIDANNYIYVGDENGNIYRTLYNASTFWLSIGNPVLGSFSMDNRGFVYIWDSHNIFYALGEELLSYSSVFSYKNEDLLGVSLEDILSLDTNEDLVSDSDMEYTFLDATRIIFTGDEFEENSYYVYSDDIIEAEIYDQDTGEGSLDEYGINPLFDEESGEYVYAVDNLSGNTIYLEQFTSLWMISPTSDYEQEYPDIPFDDEGIEDCFIIDGKNSTLDLNNHEYFFTFIKSYPHEMYEDPDYQMRSYIIFKNFNFVNMKCSINNGYNGKVINNIDEFDGIIIFYNCTFVNFTHTDSSTSFFQVYNLKIICSTFINITTPPLYEHWKLNGFGGAFFLHENVTIKDCTFFNIGGGKLFGINFYNGYDANLPQFYEPHNIVIINNRIILDMEYIFVFNGWDIEEILFENNYFISNAGNIGNERYGMDAIRSYEQDDFINDDFKTQIYKNYVCSINYPLQINVTVTTNSTHLIFTLDDMDNGTLTYGDNNIPILNGVGSYPVSGSPGESITGSTSFLGDKYYARSSDFTVTLPKTDPDFTIEANPIIYNQSIPGVTINTDNDPDFNITVWDVNNNLVYNTSSKKGSINLKELAAGNYIINVTSIGDAIYNSVSKTTALIIGQASTEITSTEVNNNNLVITLNNSLVNGAASVNINNISYYADVEDGIITLNISSLDPKEYTATVSYLGNTNFKAFNDEEITFTIGDARTAPSISTEDFTITEGQNALINVTVAGATGDIVVIIGETKYLATLNDENNATITIPG
ncbi:MAG: PQQ-like beta-propeller repeat protein, partial [Methanobrevibacter sp.]|nr:PQQ-like beta-propeller repeat protein [Methanobrevibacter sp.]